MTWLSDSDSDLSRWKAANGFETFESKGYPCLATDQFEIQIDGYDQRA